MTTYNTGNPIGSTDPKDLYDNAQNLDALVNSTTDLSHADRLGAQRKTWHGMEVEFDAAQAERSGEFAQFLADSAYQDLGVYGSGIEVTRYNQVFLKDGEFYRSAASLGLPYTTTGVWASESGRFVGVGDAVLRQDISEPGGSGVVGFEQSGIGAVATTVEDKARQTVALWDFLTSAQKSDITSGAGTIDVLPALNAAIASAVQPGTFVYPVSGIVELPRGTLFLNGTLTLTSSVHLIGHGAGQQGGNWATKLKFPANTTGVTVIASATGPNQNGAGASIIEGTFFEGGGGTLGSAHGLDMQARVKLRDVVFSGFSGNGVNIVADMANRKNANCWLIDSASLLSNGMHGLYLQGGDTNAGHASGIDASYNGGFGILDESFLGNTYIGCHTDVNGKKSMVHYGGNRYYCADQSLAGSTTPGTNSSVWVLIGAGGSSTFHPDWVSGGTYLVGGAYGSTNSNARNIFIGCYSEPGSQPPSRIKAPAMVVGGLHTAGFTSDSTSTRFLDATFTAITSQPSSGGARISIGAGSNGDTGALLGLSDPSSSGNFPYRLKYTTGKWFLNWANITEHLHLYNRDATPANGFARDLSGQNGGIGMPSGYYAPGMKYRGGAAAAPTTGTYVQGDIIYNTSPAASGFIGWVCVTGGTPGTWKTFGAISA